MEMRSSFYNCQSVLCHFFVENIIGVIGTGMNGIFGTRSDTTSATDTFIMVYGSFSVFNGNGRVGAIFCTHSATNTLIVIYQRFSAGMHFHFSCSGTATHSDILYGTTESRSFVGFKMGQRNKNIGIHNCSSDFCFFYEFPFRQRNIFFVQTFYSISDNDMATGRKRCKAVFVCSIDVVQSVFPSANIQCVTVC